MTTDFLNFGRKARKFICSKPKRERLQPNVLFWGKFYDNYYVQVHSYTSEQIFGIYSK